MKSILTCCILIAVCACTKWNSDEPVTTISGKVTDTRGKAVSGAKLIAYKSTGGIVNWAPSYEIVDSTRSAGDGSYYMKFPEGASRIYVSKEGFFNLDSNTRYITPFSKNSMDFILNPGCKVNFHLQNPQGHEAVCINVPKPQQCEFHFSLKCFYELPEVHTSCFVPGGDTVSIRHYYRSGGTNSPEITLDIWCPEGGEINVDIVY